MPAPVFCLPPCLATTSGRSAFLTGRRAARCVGARCRELPPGVRGGEPRSDWSLAPVVRGGGSARGLPVFVGLGRPSERGEEQLRLLSVSWPPLPLRVVYDLPRVGSREAPVS